jgi:glycosyltransferase A (GT-A) superfamily protein (DUF2064 family)
MKLPNGERAMVELEKLQTYCLNQHHPRGRHKARVFAAVGILEEHAAQLQKALLEAAQTGDAEVGTPSPYGSRFVVDFDLLHEGRTIRIRSAWIIRSGEDLPRLTTCYVL